jgi:hypothetical protein
VTRGRLLVIGILSVTLLAGALMWWLQTRAFYREVAAQSFAVARADGGVAELPVADWRGIDSSSSPIRFRACFRLPEGAPADLAPYALPTPLIAPGWFDCFDARAIGAALDAGEARAVRAAPTGIDGVDRVLAVFADGRAYAWNQIDRCGVLVSPEDRPAACPPAAEAR